MHILRCSTWITPLFILRLAHAAAEEPLRSLETKLHHLRSGSQAEWQEFADQAPEGRRLEVRFDAQANEREATLLLRQDDVKLDWGVELNGRKIGRLFLMEASLVQAIAIPARTLRNAQNTLAITPPGGNDDILVGDFKLLPRPLAEGLSQATALIEVTDAATDKGLPCRLTILEARGGLAPFYSGPEQPLAARPGVVYTPDGQARLGLMPGEYTVCATRGLEFGVATQRFSITGGQTLPVRLQIRREVATPGLVSSDTHVHTFTYSHHGDATIDERMLTLAGEGIELPIATDHDCLTDYAGPARKMNVADWFTPVVGCEVTTAKGHFNIFPVTPGSPAPDARVTDWPQLMQSLRSKPGVRVVILNHPRNIHSNFQPFAAANFNAVTGENRRGFEFSFDAIEVVNSSALQSDLTLGWRDWFALLNYGYRVTAVGSSDGHDVSRYIVGQGRTYVACDDSNPGRINLEDACRSFLKGRATVSLGLLAQMQVNDRFGLGDLATNLGPEVQVAVSVLGPSWTRADRVELFANGVKIREQQIEGSRPLPPESAKGGEKARIIWKLPRPWHDASMVAIASGPPVTAQYWAIARPYQPTSLVWQPRVLGITNPIWIDGDGDGKFTAARAYAKRLFQQTRAQPARLLRALASYDEAIAAQAASLCQASGSDIRGPEFTQLLNTAPEQVRRGFTAFAATLATTDRGSGEKTPD